MFRFWKRETIAQRSQARPVDQSPDGIEALEQRLLFARAAGVDVSYYQGPSINWSSVKAAGISFAAIRASTGSSSNTYNDPYLATNEANAQAAGIVTGVYHYAYPQNNTAVAEATHFVNTAGKYMGPGFLPPELDLEEDGSSTATGIAYLSQWANDFCNYVYTHTGAKPMIYCNTNYAQNYVNTTVSQWYLWIANYNYSSTGDPPVGDSNSGWPASSWKFFQYTSTGSISGISGNVDHDVFNGTTADLTTFLNPGPQIAITTAGTALVDGSSTVDYGTVLNGATAVSKTFVVQNVGSETLTLSGLTVPTGYTITDGLVSSLAPGATDNLILKLPTTSSGKKIGTVSITTNDSDNNPFTWSLTGAIIPKAPTNLAVSATTNNSVSLSWTDNSDESVFLIERKTGAGGTYAQVSAISPNATTFTDSTVPNPNTTYYYRVRDAAFGPVYSSYSNEVSTTTLANTPTGLSASDGTSSSAIHLTWLAATGATSYSIWRSSTNDPNTAAQIATTTNLSYDDSTAPADTVTYYWVRAVNSASQPSAFSASDPGSRDTIAPSIVASSFYYDALPQAIIVQFSEDVSGSLSTADVSVQDENHLDQAAFNPTSWTYDSATSTATFTFGSQLPDSSYRATIPKADVSDPADNSMTSDLTLDFFTLSGDGDHSGTVNLQDFNILASNFGKTGQTYSQGNYDYSSDGTISLTDFNVLATNFGRTLQMPASPQIAEAKTDIAPTTGTTVVTTTTSQVLTQTTSMQDDRLLRDSGLL